MYSKKSGKGTEKTIRHKMNYFIWLFYSFFVCHTSLQYYICFTYNVSIYLSGPLNTREVARDFKMVSTISVVCSLTVGMFSVFEWISSEHNFTVISFRHLFFIVNIPILSTHYAEAPDEFTVKISVLFVFLGAWQKITDIHLAGKF